MKALFLKLYTENCKNDYKDQRIKDVTILGYNLVAKLIKIRIQSVSI